MMRIVLYTQRVEIIESYNERRDCADQKLPEFIKECGYLPVPIPNILCVAERMLTCLNPIGIVLTGGNNLEKYNGDAPERDAVEKEILRIGLKKDIPIYGFCRGMQVIEDYFEAELQYVENHVAVRHNICGNIGQHIVNSYHNLACYQVPDSLEVLAVSEDGVIEAIHVKNKWIIGNMWHPERENPFQKEDIDRVKTLFEKKEKII